MWYVFDTMFFTLRGIVSNFSEMTINHNFYEVDTMTFSIPFDTDTYEILRTGRILYRKNSNKGFMIHTLEIQESEHTIIGYAYGLESVLDNRVVISPTNFNTNHETIIHDLIDKNMINSTKNYRNIINLTKGINGNRGIISEESYWGESLYAIFTELGKRSSIGFKVFFHPNEQTFEFITRVGVDRTINQTTNQPIRWVHEWDDTYDEVLTISEKDSKSVVYIASGDEVPIQTTVGDELAFKGDWLRKEMFVQASDITKTLQDESQTTLTTAQVNALLRSRGKLEMLSKRPVNDYTFTLSEGIDEVYGVDYLEGDYVSVVNQTYDLVKHQQITTVEERIIGDLSQFNIKFDEGGN